MFSVFIAIFLSFVPIICWNSFPDIPYSMYSNINRIIIHLSSLTNLLGLPDKAEDPVTKKQVLAIGLIFNDKVAIEGIKS